MGQWGCVRPTPVLDQTAASPFRTGSTSLGKVFSELGISAADSSGTASPKSNGEIRAGIRAGSFGRSAPPGQHKTIPGRRSAVGPGD